MMIFRRLILVAAAGTVGLAESALAEELPVPGFFGSSELACRGFLEDGKGRLVAGPAGALAVSPWEIAGVEWGCRPTAVSDNSATLACSGEGGAWTDTATFREEGDTLTIKMGDEPPVALQRCPVEIGTHAIFQGDPTLDFFDVRCEGQYHPECVLVRVFCDSQINVSLPLTDAELSRWLIQAGGLASKLVIGRTEIKLVPHEMSSNELDRGWYVRFYSDNQFSAVPSDDLASDKWSLAKLEATMTLPVSGKNRAAVDAFLKACP